MAGGGQPVREDHFDSDYFTEKTWYKRGAF
jgi:hypothetical protein